MSQGNQVRIGIAADTLDHYAALSGGRGASVHEQIATLRQDLELLEQEMAPDAEAESVAPAEAPQGAGCYFSYSGSGA